MRLPNITSSNSIIQKIKELDQQRFKLDAQITSGQKLTLPEDDGMRLGRVIQLETQKSQLTQYQRNASYAKEYLDAGYLNLDKLVELNQRGQEIARTAGSSLNGPAMETYGNEINQLIEEALNRVNSTHRKQALFGGTKLKPVFNNSDIQLGEREQKLFLFNEVGSVGNDGIRRIKSGEVLSLSLNGREYVFEAKVDGVSIDKVSSILNNLIINDKGALSDSLSYDETNFKAFVRGGANNTIRNPNVQLNSELTINGDLIVHGSVGQSFEASSEYTTNWDPNHYFPEQLEQKLNSEAFSLYPGLDYESLGDSEKAIVRANVEGSAWTRKLTVNQSKVDGTASLEIDHKENWRRLNIYKLGEVVEYEGRLFESKISDNVNHSPTNSGTDYWRELGSAYDVDREDWNLNVSGVKNRFYYSTPDGKLFSDQASATSHAENILVASKTTEYQNSADPALAFSTDLAAAVKLVSIPINEFSVDGSESNATVFFNPETMDYELVAASEGGAIVNGTFLKENNQIFSASQTFQNNDVVLHNGRYFLVENANAVVAENLDYIEEKLPPSGEVIQYSGQVANISDGAPIALKSGQYLFDDTNSAYYFANQDITLSATDVTAILSQTDSTLSNSPPDPSSLNSFNSSVHMAGDFISPDGSTIMVASDVMRGTFDPKKEYAVGDVVWAGSDPSGQGMYYEFQTNQHLGEWIEAESVIVGQTVVKDGKLYQSSASLDADSNNISNFNSNWQLLSDSSSIDKFTTVTDVSNVVSNEASLDVSILDRSTNKYFKEFDSSTNTISSPLPSGLLNVGFPPDDLVLKKGQYLHDSVSDKYFAVTNDLTFSLNGGAALDSTNEPNLVELTERSDGNVFLLGDSLPVEGKEHIYSTDLSLDANIGDFVYDSTNDDFYVVKQTISKPAGWSGGIPDYSLQEGAFFSKIGSGSPSPRLSIQGEQWDSNNTYGLGQIVYNEGKYYQAQIDGTKGISPPSGDLNLNANWIQVEKSLNHVLKFRVDSTLQPKVTIPSSGSAGVDAKADAIVDSEGRVVGLKVLDPGRYFFGSSTNVSIPNSFKTAEVDFPNGEKLKVDVLWGVNPSDPGTYRVLGFEIPTDSPRANTRMSASLGDEFSFATGTKTFIDHRDRSGNVVNVTYTGASQNSEYYVGNESKISGFLDAKNDGTKELGDFVQSLIDLREALKNATPSHYSQEVEDEENKLIQQEEKIINKLGELSSKMVRMETVRAHDEDYFVQLDQRIARDVDIDLSESIMRLTKLSTSYQAALQIGSQLLNTSLLNYL
jgi:flagellin-like hook-associated protein FlgL